MVHCDVVSHNKGFETWQDYEDGVGHNLIMQFTGLQDKNGKDIYEGDIVKVYLARIDGSIEDETICTVSIGEQIMNINGGEYTSCFYGVGFEPLDNTKIADEGWYDDYYTVEVIGNICENPELITDE